jgi:hypothetical protein
MTADVASMQVEWVARRLESLCRERYPAAVAESEFHQRFRGPGPEALAAGMEAAVRRGRVLRLRRLSVGGDGRLAGAWFYAALAPARKGEGS